MQKLPPVSLPPPHMGLPEGDRYGRLSSHETDPAGDEFEGVAQVTGMAGGQQAVLEMPLDVLRRDPVEPSSAGTSPPPVHSFSCRLLLKDSSQRCRR